MKAQRYGEHARSEANVVVDPVGRTAVMMQSGHVRAHPDANVGQWIKAPRLRIGFVPIKRRCPVNGHATEDEAEKDWQVQPVTAPDEQVVPANNTHAGFRLRRACSDSFVLELRGM